MPIALLGLLYFLLCKAKKMLVSCNNHEFESTIHMVIKLSFGMCHFFSWKRNMSFANSALEVGHVKQRLSIPRNTSFGLTKAHPSPFRLFEAIWKCMTTQENAMHSVIVNCIKIHWNTAFFIIAKQRFTFLVLSMISCVTKNFFSEV